MHNYAQIIAFKETYEEYFSPAPTISTQDKVRTLDFRFEITVYLIQVIKLIILLPLHR